MTERSSARVLADFQGIWQLSRVIQHASGATAHFEGVACWKPAKGGMQYREEGQMILEGHAPLQAERSYFWADDLSVFFDDGRFFHRVPGLGGASKHWCDPDSYILTYDFSRWPGFRVIWQVTGPRKDYRAETDYTRR